MILFCVSILNFVILFFIKVYLLVGILGTCSVISIILSLFLNDIDYIVKENGITTKQIGIRKKLTRLSELKKID